MTVHIEGTKICPRCSAEISILDADHDCLSERIDELEKRVKALEKRGTK